MRPIFTEQLPPKLRSAVQRYLKRNGRDKDRVLYYEFGLAGDKWVVRDRQGRHGFGTTPVGAIRRLVKTASAFSPWIGFSSTQEQAQDATHEASKPPVTLPVQSESPEVYEQNK